MKSISAFLATTAFASTSPWVTDFDGMLAAVGCSSGPRQCGATNFFAESGEECGYGRGCQTYSGIDHEACIEVAKW